MDKISVVHLLHLAHLGALQISRDADTEVLHLRSLDLAHQLQALEDSQVALEAARDDIQLFTCWASDIESDPAPDPNAIF